MPLCVWLVHDDEREGERECGSGDRVVDSKTMLRAPSFTYFHDALLEFEIRFMAVRSCLSLF